MLKCSKSAICKIILEAEEKCTPLRFPNDFNKPVSSAQFDKTWHQVFAEICFEDVERDNLEAALKNISVISFNYDRCFERFVEIALMGLYGFSHEEAQLKAPKLEVLHPYGVLGRLPGAWPGISQLNFGNHEPNIDLIAVQLSESIRTFTEGTEGEPEINSIQDLIASAENIVFMGFGFHEQNMKLLAPNPYQGSREINVLGTAKGLSRAAKLNVERKIGERFMNARSDKRSDDNAFLFDMTCYEFMTANRHALIAK